MRRSSPPPVVGKTTGTTIAKGRGKNVATYNPEKGLTTIAAAREGERIAKRARDVEGLREAGKIKMLAQAEYVCWRDGVVVPSRKAGAPGRGKKGKRIEPIRPVLPDGDPGDDIAYRWRKHLCTKDGAGNTRIDPQKLETAVDEAALRSLRAFEMEPPHLHRTQGTGNDEWHTPEEYIEAAREVMGGVDLDPASNADAQRTVRAAKYFTKVNDGLAHEWHGRVFLNSPYSKPLIEHFVAKLIAEYQAGRVTEAIMLTHNSSDTAWCQDALRAARVFCLTRGRVRFVAPPDADPDSNSGPLQGQCFFYFGNRPDAFAARFADIGFVAAGWATITSSAHNKSAPSADPPSP